MLKLVYLIKLNHLILRFIILDIYSIIWLIIIFDMNIFQLDLHLKADESLKTEKLFLSGN